MELANIYIGNSHDSKSSPDLIQFIPFNNDEDECYYCKGSYSKTRLFCQKYCKNCLMLYIKYADNTNLDVYITKGSQCRKHKTRSLNFCTQNIKEWCNSCSEILCFKQIVTNNRLEFSWFYYINRVYFKKIKNCGLCSKSIYQQKYSNKLDYIEFKLCSNCYKISSGWIESTLTKRSIPILYLPWWDTHNQCIACDQFLEFKSICQKLCSYCRIIYTGCRYCLTTNIIFGIT
ncbi:hypothetical protein RhiirB3_444802 [Rhizophagus irregularis]|nr:hypothetical protein RhiirB3_444802 [Rhizophagus irregularis]